MLRGGAATRPRHRPTLPSGMGEIDVPPPEPSKALSAEDRARVLDKLHRLETAALFTPGWDALYPDLDRWRRTAKYGQLLCRDVPRMAAAFEAYGIE